MKVTKQMIFVVLRQVKETEHYLELAKKKLANCTEDVEIFGQNRIVVAYQSLYNDSRKLLRQMLESYKKNRKKP